MRTRALRTCAKQVVEASTQRAETATNLASTIVWVRMSDISDAIKLEKGWMQSVRGVVKRVTRRAGANAPAMGPAKTAVDGKRGRGFTFLTRPEEENHSNWQCAMAECVL